VRKKIYKLADVKFLVWLSKLNKDEIDTLTREENYEDKLHARAMLQRTLSQDDLDCILRWCDNKNEAGVSELEMCVKGLCLVQDMFNTTGVTQLPEFIWDKVGSWMQTEELLKLHLMSEKDNYPNTAIANANYTTNNAHELNQS
jgi:hypothetical protein